MQTNQNIKNRLFPVFLKLEELNVLLVGGGNVGLEKLSAMLNNSPDSTVTVVADMFRDEIREYVKDYPKVTLVERRFDFNDLNDKDLVVLATDNPDLHASIKRVTAERHILCNVADTPDLCDFYLGSIVQKGDLKIGISTNGKSPTMAKRMREFLDDIIPENIQQLLDNLREIRKSIKGDFQEKIRVLNEVTEKMVNDRKP
ncbi:bifunctional precorrin-2 dehydrogenase/sirohydrochlorin ferrochelatase [Arcicella sp. LKC2W]|uniref:precorrin-2 dehydrogenase/sirohydrochlorin ferrochelatase family protein n=1 Tax=Arcicella sp. LKC2W TaxID=2984198 RepID=UPI002B21B128|nr:bifunctional precorrin-2 dehydrogenase/sirohydrochlorin ferrochelatase [Arcicella sp. LKC2W]MEA5461409.1 bifunctional precorrin-2 dehydrogenase/sirohydrochlorin ferrochelatase [Arcicella sp. LKC2W]